jgi:hypothetical protein
LLGEHVHGMTSFAVRGPGRRAGGVRPDLPGIVDY